MSEQHKHAAVLRAIANGDKVSDFEFNCDAWKEKKFICFSQANMLLLTEPDSFTIRRKQKTHVVNGFTVPEPLWEKPALDEAFFIEQPAIDKFFIGYTWGEFPIAQNSFERGIAHATKEGAIANCKARLGIDPYKDDQCSD